MNKLIKDRHGRVLKFSQERTEELVYFKLEFHESCAAYANCQIEGGVLVLADLFVEDHCVVRHPSYLMRLFGRKTLKVNFRKQGIGGQLLKTISVYARSKGLQRVECRLAANEMQANPQLARWFQKRGFTIMQSMVCLDLAAPSADDSRYKPS